MGREIHLTNKSKAGHVIAETHDSRIDQNDALLLMRAAVILCKFCLQKVESFTASFSPECLTAPAAEQVMCFINFVLQGPSILQAVVNNDDNMDLDIRMHIAARISQLVI